MDGDLQDPPEVVAELVARWQQGFDVVHARRRRRAGETWMKLLTARVFYRLFAAMAPVPTVPDSGDFRLMSRRVVLAMRGLEESHRFLRGLVAWVGFRQTVVEYDRPERPAGKTKFPFTRMASFAMDGITSFSTAPLRLATYLGMLVGLVAVAVAGWAAWDHFVAHRTIQGWTSLIVVVSLIGAVQFVLIGIVGAYVGRIYEEVKRRPLYIVAEEFSSASSGERSPKSIAR